MQRETQRETQQETQQETQLERGAMFRPRPIKWVPHP